MGVVQIAVGLEIAPGGAPADENARTEGGGQGHARLLPDKTGDGLGNVVAGVAPSDA